MNKILNLNYKMIFRPQNALKLTLVVAGVTLVGYNVTAKADETVDTRPDNILYTYLEKDVVTEKASDRTPAPTYHTVATVASASVSQSFGYEAKSPFQTKDEAVVSSSQAGQVLEKPLVSQTDAVSYKRDDVVTHEVQSGETLSQIAESYNLKLTTVLWENGLYEESVVQTGDELTILPVDGVRYKMPEETDFETVDDLYSYLATYYNSKTELIEAFNKLDQLPEAGDYLTIPDGTHPDPARAPEPEPEEETYVAAASYDSGYSSAPSQVYTGGGGTGHRFPYGWCTYWVASKRYIPWGGNANAWVGNARAYGYATGSTPVVGAVYAEPWLTGWGHVSYVESVHADGSFTVSEMNYVGWGRSSTRTVGAGAGGTFIY